jgi:hypothetical protein
MTRVAGWLQLHACGMDVQFTCSPPAGLPSPFAVGTFTLTSSGVGRHVIVGGVCAVNEKSMVGEPVEAICPDVPRGKPVGPVLLSTTFAVVPVGRGGLDCMVTDVE